MELREAGILLTVRTEDGRFVQVRSHTFPGQADLLYDYIVLRHAEGRNMEIDLLIPPTPSATEVSRP